MNEVGTGLILQETQALAQPHTLSLLHQELISGHHCIYHLPFRILFRLESMGFLPKRLLECRNKTPRFLSFQFGWAHRPPWRTNGNRSGLIHRPDQTNPGNGILVDHIVSAQPRLIPQISGFLTIQSF